MRLDPKSITVITSLIQVQTVIYNGMGPVEDSGMNAWSHPEAGPKEAYLQDGRCVRWVRNLAWDVLLRQKLSCSHHQTHRVVKESERLEAIATSICGQVS